MTARRSSLLYLEKIRLFHAAITVALTIALVAWAVVLWLNGQATTGEVVLVCTLGMSILHATRDLAVALVDVTQQSLREAIAVVPQDISLFHRSIMENIRYGRQDASDEDVMAAAMTARCVNFIDALPEGTSTIVGDRGLKLSGGQRQRIAIARAFLKDAPILLLDEATSALDSESEEEIRQALDRLMRGRTVIAIAHRLSTLRSFDRIVVMQAGRIVQDGPPDKLMRRSGLYRDLIEREVTRLRRVA